MSAKHNDNNGACDDLIQAERVIAALKAEQQTLRNRAAEAELKYDSVDGQYRDLERRHREFKRAVEVLIREFAKG